jgi:16S rRNA (guanine966-N2)-methyltransferase
VPDAGRVISGSARGIRLAAPPSGTRPLADRVKQTLFDILESAGALVGDAAVLDLFAGSGAAGIEALSRGAEVAVFVERDPKAASVIADNLRRSHLEGGRVVRGEVLHYLKAPSAEVAAPFQAVIVDPPYDQHMLVPALERLGDPSGGWLRHDGVVVAKHFWRDVPAPEIGGLKAYRDRRFGETMLTFYRFSAPSAASSTEAT